MKGETDRQTEIERQRDIQTGRQTQRSERKKGDRET